MKCDNTGEIREKICNNKQLQNKTDDYQKKKKKIKKSAFMMEFP